MAKRSFSRLHLVAALALLLSLGVAMLPSTASATTGVVAGSGNVMVGHPGTVFPGGYTETEFYVDYRCNDWPKNIQGIDAYIMAIDPSLPFFNVKGQNLAAASGITVSMYTSDQSGDWCGRSRTYFWAPGSSVLPMETLSANWAVISFTDGYDIDFLTRNCGADPSNPKKATAGCTF